MEIIMNRPTVEVLAVLASTVAIAIVRVVAACKWLATDLRSKFA